MTDITRRVGDRIGNRYRIISHLREGGMGVTYRAWDEMSGIPVVAKEPQRKFLHVPGFLERFQREIHTLVRHPHPHIVPIVDVGTDNGLPFYVMRFLPGGSLADRRLRDPMGTVRPMQPATLHLWIWHIAAALDFIHAAGVVHRDVKPANIFFDSGWAAFLGDFGVAKNIAGQPDHDLTGTNDVLGTEKYMAPEQISAQAPLDGRADQYALAVIAYDLVAGRPPFIGDTTHVFVEIATQPVPPLSLFRHDISQTFQASLYRALAKHPAERFGSCTQFVSALLHDVPRLTDEPGIARFLCPKCRTILRLPSSAGGQQGRCPRCRKGMMVAADLSALWLLSEASAIAEAAEPEPATVFGQDDPGPRMAAPETIAPPVVREPRRPSFPPTAPSANRTPLVAIAVALCAVAALAAWAPWNPTRSPLDVAWETLERNPADPAANEVVGRFYAREGDWPRALPHFEASQRPDYRDPARREREVRAGSRPASGDLLQVSRTWWKLADRFPADSRDRKAIEAHSAQVYRECVGRLVDLGDVEEANDWLDRDKRFREMVGNERPTRGKPRVREQRVFETLSRKREGGIEVRGTSLVMRPASNAEAGVVVAVPRGATAIVGTVRLAGDPAGKQIVAQVARPDGPILWQSRKMAGSRASEVLQIEVPSGTSDLELRAKIPVGTAAVEWVDARFVIPHKQ